MTAIPACKECKHFRVHRDDMFSTCALYQYENVDYFNGTVTKHNALALAMRDKEQYCGREGKNFEQREVPVEIKKSSKWDHFKNFLRLIDF
jgi:hypothetical protein